MFFSLSLIKQVTRGPHEHVLMTWFTNIYCNVAQTSKYYLLYYNGHA